MKRIISILLSLLILMTLPLTVIAEPIEREVWITGINPDWPAYYEDDAHFTTRPYNGAEYISLNKLTKFIEYEWHWDETAQTLTLWSPYRDMQITIGSTYYYYNGFIHEKKREIDGQIQQQYGQVRYTTISDCETFEFHIPPIILDGEVYIPINMIARLFGAITEIRYDGGLQITVDYTYHDICKDAYTSENVVSLLTGNRYKEYFTANCTTTDSYFPRDTSFKPQTLIKYTFEMISGVVKEIYSWDDEDRRISLSDRSQDRDWYIIVLEDGREFTVYNGSRTTYNTRCFDSEYQELTPSEMHNLVGKVVNFAIKQRFIGESSIPETDDFPYAMVLDKVATTELEEERSKSQEVQEQPTQPQPTFYTGNINVFYNGEKITFDQEPVIEDGRTLVPMRKIFETLGAEVEWVDYSKAVSANKGDTEIWLPIDSNIALKNGNIINLDVPARLINDRTMVPVRFIADCLGVTTDWDGDTRTVYLYSN